jgi:uncharacterized protein
VKVWIDLSNSPHALFFGPMARRVEELGHTILVTARDNAQTVDLGRAYWPELVVVGGESPRGRVAKVHTLAARIDALRRIAGRERPDVALSHNSYAQIVAAKLAGIRAVTAMDFEFQPANHLAFRLAERVLLPEALRSTGVKRQGAKDRKTSYYPGLKEEFYLGDFHPDKSVLDDLACGRERLCVVLRTPPSRAIYHRFGNPLFEDVLRVVGADPGAVCVVLARHPEQRRAITELGLPSVVVPPSAVDARSLMYGADLVIGAGGTMTREAALLGVPTVSVFAGPVPAVDRVLIERGLLQRITATEEILPLERRRRSPRPVGDLARRRDELVTWLVDVAGLARPIKR